MGRAGATDHPAKSIPMIFGKGGRARERAHNRVNFALQLEVHRVGAHRLDLYTDLLGPTLGRGRHHEAQVLGPSAVVLVHDAADQFGLLPRSARPEHEFIDVHQPPNQRPPHQAECCRAERDRGQRNEKAHAHRVVWCGVV